LRPGTGIHDHVERKRRRVRLLQRYLLNPPVLLAVRLGLVPGYVRLETTGRRTGKRRRTVVGRCGTATGCRSSPSRDRTPQLPLERGEPLLPGPVRSD
jgi:hypothetical protein